MRSMILRVFVLCSTLLGVGGGLGMTASFALADAPNLLSPDDAFKFSARVISPQAVEVRYQIADGYYLYRERTKFKVVAGAVTLGEAQFPPGVKKTDKYFGTMETYRGDLRIVLPVSAERLPAQWTLDVESQGCADVGVCYAPQNHQAQLTLTAASVAPANDRGNAGFSFFGGANDADNANGINAGIAPRSEDARIAALFQGGVWALLASYFGFGLLLAFTPCVLPMIPILSGILVPHGAALTKTRGFLLSLAYVLGMALTYAAIGVAAAALLGTLLPDALQNIWVLGAFALLFVALALSMFGLYELQMPSALQGRLAAESNKLSGGHFLGVFTMGVLSALIVGPCVAAPLAGALLYISQSGNVLLGGSALFVMALGMGVPLLVVGASSGALLPKAGAWMESIKKVFGVIFLGVAIYIISPVIPVALSLALRAALSIVCAIFLHALDALPANASGYRKLWKGVGVLFLLDGIVGLVGALLGGRIVLQPLLALWATLLIASTIFLHALDALPANASGYRKLWKGVGVFFLLVGIVELVGALSGGRSVLQPLEGLRAADTSAAVEPALFQRVATSAELDQRVRAAGRPVMFDFYADWCVTCKEMEHETFTDPRVRARLDRMLLLQADVTANTDADKALLKRFNLFGPPGIVFFDANGQQVPGLRIVGFQSADEFLRTLDQVAP